MEEWRQIKIISYCIYSSYGPKNDNIFSNVLSENLFLNKFLNVYLFIEALIFV